ncbi:hypothetical protein HMPREF1584_00831 [Gardnerella vaginalis JCP8481A]|nr:hypothetical protein HMPREF1585_00932 [Gardnerella vaginalis JCP8481B]EPI42735.1 hypothetical protein HMPREF1584_00831 [Gardnerella vaginalis JCP8481A]
MLIKARNIKNITLTKLQIIEPLSNVKLFFLYKNKHYSKIE